MEGLIVCSLIAFVIGAVLGSRSGGPDADTVAKSEGRSAQEDTWEEVDRIYNGPGADDHDKPEKEKG